MNEASEIARFILLRRSKRLDSKKQCSFHRSKFLRQAKLKGRRKFFSSQASVMLILIVHVFRYLHVNVKRGTGMSMDRCCWLGRRPEGVHRRDCVTMMQKPCYGLLTMVSRQYLCGLLWFYFRCIRCCCRRRRSCGRLPSLGAANSEIERISFTKCWLDSMTHICPFTSSLLQLTFLVNKLIFVFCCFCSHRSC